MKIGNEPGTIDEGDVSDEIQRFQLTEELHAKKKCDELRFAVKDIILTELQTYCVMYGLINRRCIISTDTGLGKTCIAAGLYNILKNKNPFLKGLIIAPSYGVTQICQDFTRYTYDAVVKSTNAQAFSVDTITALESSAWDLLVLSYEAVCSPVLEEYLLAHRQQIDFVVIDESQLLANLSGAASNILYSMCKYMRYVYMLTATPIRVSVAQFIKQIYVLDRDVFSGQSLSQMIRHFTLYDDMGNPVGAKNVEELLDLNWDRYISCTRKDWGYKGNYILDIGWVDAGSKYREVPKKGFVSTIKGDKDGPALAKLAEMLRGYLAQGKKGLIYVNTNENKELVQWYLAERGISSEILDGSHTNTNAKKEGVKTRFRKGEVCCLITNLTVCLNLDCDFIMFYETTFDAKQFIGRGERGYGRKDLIIGFVLVLNSADEEYFYDRVYKRAQELEKVCSKDVEEILRVGKEIDARRNARDNYNPYIIS